MKLVLILVLMIVSVMAVVGTFLINSVSTFYIDSFYTQMQSVFTTDTIRSMQEAAGRALVARRLTVSTAESCTGGLLSKRITDIPGCSDYYLGGVCSYANEVKMNVLGVRKETLDTVGAVSAETAEQMAAGVAKALGADIGVGITGIAGPGGGTEDKPTGLVYISVWYDGKFFTRKMQSSLGRDRVRMQAASTALDLIRRHIF